MALVAKACRIAHEAAQLHRYVMRWALRDIWFLALTLEDPIDHSLYHVKRPFLTRTDHSDEADALITALHQPPCACPSPAIV